MIWSLRDSLVAEELVACLGGGQAGVGQQSGEAGGGGDGDEGGAGFAQGGQQGEQVAAQGAGVGDLDRVGAAVVLDRGEHELVLVGPAAVEHGDPGVGAGGDGLHRQAGEADLDQLVPGGVEQRGFEFWAASAAADGLAVGVATSLRLERLAFLSKLAYPHKRWIPLLIEDGPMTETTVESAELRRSCHRRCARRCWR